MTTADWQGGPPETTLWTQSSHHTGLYGPWGTRRVKRDGRVKWNRHWFRAPEDAVIQPEPGEILLFTSYGEIDRETRIRMGRDPEHAREWTAPADPDGVIRRMFWVHDCCGHPQGGGAPEDGNRP